MKVLSDYDIAAAIRGEAFQAPYEKLLSLELAFTEVYRRFQDAPVSRREAECLRIQFPAILQPIQSDDLFAGRIRYPLVGFSPEPMGLGYYCREEPIREILKKHSFSQEERGRVEEMLDFWSRESTQAKVMAAYPAAVQEALPTGAWDTDSAIAFPLYRMAGITLDYGKLMHLGVPGLKQLVSQWETRAGDGRAQDLFQGMKMAVGLLESVLIHYEAQAEAQGMKEIAGVLRPLVERPPQTFREAIQLFWIYALVSGTWNYGRMDTYLSAFLERDLESGRLSHDEALALTQSLWKLMAAYDNMFNNRVFVGGKGRPDESAADKFALLAIETTRILGINQPQLSLRFYEGQNPELMDAALTCIGGGRTFPILYNDDENIPAVVRAFGVSEEEAIRYMPYGCGEYTIEHSGTGTPNGIMNLLKALEVTLHNGIDPHTGIRGGLATGGPEGFKTFEDLWAAYARQVEYVLEALAQQEKIAYEETGKEGSFLFISMLFDDCLARGVGVFQGGARYLGGTMESYGNINTADSLLAIRKLVYEDKVCSLGELIRACDGNFASQEALRKDMLHAPKFGNDDPIADAMAGRVHDHVCKTTSAQAARVGMDSYLVVVINNRTNTLMGKTTGASADGRLSGEPLVNAINPSPGRDLNGTTAFLNSLVKLDPGIHAGAVHNMKYSRQMFTRHRAKLEALLAGYFRSGGTQAMITVVDRRDLEEAMREPEKWGHLMVRVGGFSARFIDLPQDVQLEVLGRTLHE